MSNPGRTTKSGLPAWIPAVLAAGLAVIVNAMMCVVPALIAALGSGASERTLAASGIGMNTYLLSMGVHLHIANGAIDGPVAFMPLGATILLLAVAIGFAHRGVNFLELVQYRGDEIQLRAGGIRDLGIYVLAFALTYTAGIIFVSQLAKTPQVSAYFLTILATGLKAGLLAGAIGAWIGVKAVKFVDLKYFQALPRAIGIGVLAVWGSGLAVFLIRFAFSASAIIALHQKLEPGLIGTLIMVLIDVLSLPTLAAWTLAIISGGTLSLGTGSSLSLQGSTPGVLPAFPVLGTVPGPGTFPGWIYILLLIPMVAIGFGAYHAAQSVRGYTPRLKIEAAGVYALAMLIFAVVLFNLSNGRFGAGRLTQFGPEVASLILPWLAMIILVTAGVFVWQSWRDGELGVHAHLPGSLVPRTGSEDADASEHSDIVEGSVPGEYEDADVAVELDDAAMQTTAAQIPENASTAAGDKSKFDEVEGKLARFARPRIGFKRKSGERERKAQSGDDSLAKLREAVEKSVQEHEK